MGTASNILVQGPSTNRRLCGSCGELSAQDECDLLAVTYTGSVDEYQQEFGALVDQLTVISLGETTRSTTSQPSQVSTLSGHPTVRVVEDPADLTGLSIELNKSLDARDSHAATHQVLCFDSVTAMLQYTDLETAFRFLHLTTRRTSELGVTGHYHLTADAHDDQTIAMLTPLFDTVREATGDAGERTHSRQS